MVNLDRATLNSFSRTIREVSILLTSKARSSHVASCLSLAEILTALVATDVSENNDWPKRIVLSKGHAAAALYGALYADQKLDLATLLTYGKNDSILSGHVSKDSYHEIPLSTGSLGHGLPFALGKAISAEDTKEHFFCILSDGECDEGSNWEAILFAGAKKINNITVVVDYNKIQSYGRTEDVINLEPFAAKWRDFGWEAIECDGHSTSALIEAIKSECKGPKVIIAHTIKGKGVMEFEDNLLWHYRSPELEKEYDIYFNADGTHE